MTTEYRKRSLAFHEFLSSLGASNRTKDEESLLRQSLQAVEGNQKKSEADAAFNLAVVSLVSKNPKWVHEQDSDGFTLLHHAALLGLEKVVETLLVKGASTATEDHNGVPPLAYAEQGNHEGVISLLLEPRAVKQSAELKASENLREIQKIKDMIQNRDLVGLEAALASNHLINFEDKAGTTLLQVASYMGNLDAMKLLVRKNAHVNSKDNENATCLHKAVIGGYLDCTKFLVSNGAEPNVADSDGLTPLHHACYYAKVEIAKFLMSSGVDVNAEDNEKSTPLHHALSAGNQEIIEDLLNHGANVHLQDAKGATALHIAAYENHIKCVTLLIEKGANPNAKDAEGLTPIHHSCFLGHTEISKLLLQTGKINVDEKDNSGSTPLHKACFYGHLDCVKLLLEKGAQVNFPSPSTSPLHHAAYGGHLEVVEILLKKGATVNCLDSEKASPIHKASFRGNLEAVKTLIANGADIFCQDEEGSTPLHKAAYSGQSKVIEALIEGGAEVDCQDLEDGTPLHNACFNGHLQCVKLLIASQANINCADSKGASPLHLAVLNGHKDVAQLLTQQGSQVDSPDDRGMTAMHHAIAHPLCLAFLLEKGAEVDCVDHSGRTPLFYASKNSCEESARFLIIKGADLNVKDKNGMTPLDVARPSFQKVIQNAQKEKGHQVDAETQKKYQSAVKLFNQKAKTGIEYLISNDIIKGLPVEIVKFLHTAENLSKTQVGDLIGEPGPYNERLLELYVEYMDFTGLDFDDALRHFLSKFRLPGEAQKIDRIMVQFAARFVKNNPDIFTNEDTAYVLAFSIIMLNTDSHSHSIKEKDKMTKEQFLRNCRYIVDEKTLATSYLESIYFKVTTNEIKMQTEATSMFGSAEKQGWVRKQGGRIKTWKKRWLVLKNNCLYYFKGKTEQDPCGIIPLENLLVRAVDLKKAHKFAFEVYSQTGEIKSCKLESGQLVKGHHGSYLIETGSKPEMDSWISAIRSNIAFNPLYEMIKKRIDSKSGKVNEPSPEDRKSAPDFQDLHDACLMCSMGYKSAGAIKEAYGNHAVVVDDAERKLRYFLITNERLKSQMIVFCGLLPDPSLYSKKGEKASDIFTQFGFDKAADQIDKTLVRFLKKDYSVSIYGHSLGAALAVLFGLHLLSAGFKMDRVITFGQPKIIKERELAAYKALPLLRVVDHLDPVCSLFPGYSHVGPEIVLFSEAHYAQLDAHPPPGGKEPQRQSVDYNHAESYLRNLKAKVKTSVLIRFEERHTHLPNGF